MDCVPLGMEHRTGVRQRDIHVGLIVHLVLFGSAHGSVPTRLGN